MCNAIRNHFLYSVLLSVIALCGASLHARAAENLVANGDFSRGMEAWTFNKTDKARASVMEANAGGAAHALRVEIATDPADKPFSVQLRQNLNSIWKKGDIMRLEAWARSPQSVQIRPVVEAGAADDFAKSLSQVLTLSPEWKKIEVTGAATKDFPAGALTLAFHLGYSPGTVELTAIRLQNVSSPGAAPAAAAGSTPAVGAPQNLILNGDFSAPTNEPWIFSNNSPRVSRTEVADQSFQRALRLEIEAAPTNPWEARMATPKINKPLAKGSLVAVRFWARSPQKAQMGVRFQRSQAPFDKIITRNVILTPEWREYRYYARLDGDLPAEATQFEFHLGYGPGTIEVANVRVENFETGQIKDLETKFGVQSTDYWLNEDVAWKTAAFERIERYRKGDLKLRLVDAKGKPIPGAKIKLAQTRQLFRWGSAVNAARLIDTQNPDHVRYQAEVKRLYNTVVFENDMKWMDDSAQRTERALEATKWLRANGIAIRGHTLAWGSRRFLPKIVAENWNDTEKVRQMVRQRVREAAQTWKGQVYVWDAVNEAVTNKELWEKLGWDEFAEVFKIAREVDPSVKLAYNDYNIANEAPNPTGNARHRARVAELIKMLRDKGAPVDTLGDQAHINAPLTPPSRVAEIWAEMAKLGVAIEVTEFDAAIPDDQIHGAYVRDILIAAFAEPKIESLLMWGFWEGAHWGAAEGRALFRKDWTPRPAQLVYEDLVLKQWMTRVELQTDKEGAIQTRGFLGDYEATIRAGGREQVIRFSLPKEGLRQQVTF